MGLNLLYFFSRLRQMDYSKNIYLVEYGITCSLLRAEARIHA